MKNFIKARKDNSVKFITDQGKAKILGGKWTNGEPCQHIIKIETGEKKIDAIKKYNILSQINTDLFSNPHRFAHHLTSSQVMCYNFFRPLIDDNAKPSIDLMKILKDRHISIPQNSICEFETMNLVDGTSYDMTIGPVTFEIKFTEYGFGKAKSDDKHKTKFKEVYEKLINKCICFKRNPNIEEFFKYYQLFRNVLHIDDKSRYAVFIIPKDNKKCSDEFEKFVTEFIMDELISKNIQNWYWEDLLKGKEDTDFYKKYLR